MTAQVGPAGRHHVRSWLPVAVLAALAYVPTLASSPGEMPADTKLYLYLDPGGLVSRAAATFEAEQFAGWVPHQQITYLWPSGPYYWALDTIGVPDWIAHRLWIGTILFLAGAGVWRVARRLGLGAAGALVAGAVYQLSPYALPYVSRTSLLLLPWAALGWLVALTIRATDIAAATADDPPAPRWGAALVRWRAPAAIALVVATVGSANATALALIAPAPALWLLHSAWSRTIAWRSALGIAARTVAACVGVSLWWVAMLITQSRHGAPVLAYSETLEDVSRNATATEVFRGLGYWLFYGRDVYWATTTAAIDHLDRTVILVIGSAVALAGLLGLVAVRWGARRFAVLLVGVGTVLAVGVHPFDDPSPLLSLLTSDDGSGLALALRSSTRAVPLIVLGLSLGAGALVAACADLNWRWQLAPRHVVAAALLLLAVANLPALTDRAFVDPALERQEEPPEAWTSAAASLEAGDPGARVLQLPGAEFGAFRWGYTVDQPLVGLADRDLLTRDLLPLGSAPAMDLLYALDDRIQEGWLEPSAVAPVARLLGADTIWLANDSAYERFRTARPDVLSAQLATASGLTAGGTFGHVAVRPSEHPDLDPVALGTTGAGAPLPTVELLDVDDPLPVVRAKSDVVVVSGSGDGLVDAAAAEVLDGSELVLYSASFDPADLSGALEGAERLVVSDSNRDRAHHWRGSQDVHGHTEPGGPGDDVLTPTAADQRLEVFTGADPRTQTIAVQEGQVRATASAYGEPYAYRPEDRAVMAIDGDPTTAWRVGDHGDPVGERLRLDLLPGVEPATSIRLVQPAPDPGGRSISTLRIEVDGAEPVTVELDPDESTGDGQVVEVPPIPAGGSVDLVIDAVTAGDPGRRAGHAGVGFAEVDLGLGPTIEYIRTPVDAVDTVATDGSDVPVTTVLTRLRVDPRDAWRSDPEPVLRRLVELPRSGTVSVTGEIRLDHDADDRQLAGVLAPASSGPLPTASERLDGAPERAGFSAFDPDPTTAWMSSFDPVPGIRLDFAADGELGSLRLVQPAGPYSTITSLAFSDAERTVEVAVPPADDTGASAIDLAGLGLDGAITVTITGIEPQTTIDRRYGDPTVLPVAIAELSGDGVPVVSIDPAASIRVECDDQLATIDGEHLALRGATDVAALLAGDPIAVTACDETIDLDAGQHAVSGDRTSLTLDRMVIATEEDAVGGVADAGAPMPITVEVTGSGQARDITVGPCPDGCWLVFGEGFNEAWSAELDGESLGPPTLVDGGFNGWRLPPDDTARTIAVRWTAQTPVTIGLWASLVAALLCVAILAATRRPARRTSHSPMSRPHLRRRRVGDLVDRRRWVPLVVVFAVAVGLLVGWPWALVAIVWSMACALLPRVGRAPGDTLAWSGLLLALLISSWVAWLERRDRPFPNNGWTEAFEHLHRPMLFALLCVTFGILAADAGEHREPGTRGRP